MILSGALVWDSGVLVWDSGALVWDSGADTLFLVHTVHGTAGKRWSHEECGDG